MRSAHCRCHSCSARVPRGLQDVTPLRLQPAGRGLRRAERRAVDRGMGDRHRHPVPEGMKDPVSLVGRVQVVVQEPVDGLSPLGRRIIVRRARGREPADEVVEAELAGPVLRQQVMIKQGGAGFLRFGEGAAAQGGRGVQADQRAGVQAQPPEELLVVGVQRTVRQVEGRHHLRVCAAGRPGPDRAGTVPRPGRTAGTDSPGPVRRRSAGSRAGGARGARRPWRPRPGSGPCPGLRPGRTA